MEKLEKEQWKKCRHKSELRWYRFMVSLNLCIVIGIAAWFVHSFQENMDYANELKGQVVSTVESEEELDMSALQEKWEELPDNVGTVALLVFCIISLPFIVSYGYAQYRSMSIEITEKTYPEIYEIIQEYAEKLNMKKVPRIYMIQGNGVLNAFSSFVPFKQYVEIYADLLEVGYREHHDMDTIRFILGHEMAHIYYSHATMHYYYSMLFSNMIPILSQTASRAREYSCDRAGQLLSGSDGVDAMMSLTAGIHLYKAVDREDYINHAKKVKGFFIFCYNLMSDHPVTSKRVLALVHPEKSGKLY